MYLCKRYLDIDTADYLSDDPTPTDIKHLFCFVPSVPLSQIPLKWDSSVPEVSQSGTVVSQKCPKAGQKCPRSVPKWDSSVPKCPKMGQCPGPPRWDSWDSREKKPNTLALLTSMREMREGECI